VYGSLANGGLRTPINPILEITNVEGELLQKNPCLSRETKLNDDCLQIRAVDPLTAYQITDILADNQARTPAFGSHSVLEVPGHQVAVKTGTTNSLRDNWTFGYTKDYLVS